LPYRILGEDFKIMDKYAHLNIGAASYPFTIAQNMSHEEFTGSMKACECGGGGQTIINFKPI